MRRIQHLGLLTLAGILFVLASAMPAILQTVVTRDDKGREYGAPPKAASYIDYLFTIGVADVPGSDNNHLYSPIGIATNATGHVYVADKNNHRVQVYNNAKVYQYTIGESAVPGIDNAHLNFTSGVAVNGTGYVYITDTNNHRVQVFNKTGIYQYTIGTTGVSGSGPGQFNYPFGVAVNSTGDVYISESNNHRVQVFNNASIYKYTFGGPGSGDGKFNGPGGIAVNGTGHVYVADIQNSRVQVFDKAGIYQYSFGGYGSGNGLFNDPSGVAINSTGYVYVVDKMNRRVQVFDKAGIYQYTIGTGSGGTGNDRFNFPEGIALNSTGHLYVADTDYDRVQVYNNGTPLSLTIAINGGAADTNNTLVTLTLTAHDATEMRFSNNGTTYTVWEPYNTPRAWILDNVAGVRTVYFQARNEHGENGPATDTITYVQNPTGLSLLIDGGAVETNRTSVTLIPSATGATQMCFSNNGTTYTTWETYSTTKSWVLADGPGPKTVYFKARNSTYEVSPVSAAITYILSPTGLSITINGGAAATSSTSVIFTLGATGAEEMCFSNNGTTYTPWETYSPTKAWIFDGGPGPKTVYFDVRNGTINATTPVFATITYILPPTGLSISIDGGAAETGSSSVTLTLAATGATLMCFSNNGTTYTDWEAYGTTKAWILDAVAGLKTVYFKASNGTIEAAAPTTDTITFVGPPTDMFILINDGATMTASRNVMLVVWASGAEEMCFSNDGAAWSVWETFTTTKTWGLVGGLGSKIVYFQARNRYHESNISTIITYTLPPTGLSIAINGGAGETATRAVTLALSVTGATEMCFSNDGVAWSTWEPLAATKVWNLPTNGGYKTVYFKARNGTIESAGPVAAGITYTVPGQSQTDMPAWAWVILIAVLIEGVVVIAAIWFRGWNSNVRDIPPALGGEKKTRLDLLKGKVSQLKGKIFKQDAAGTVTSDKTPEAKVTEVAIKSAPAPAPKVVPPIAPAKKVEAPKPVPASVPEKKAEIPKPAPAPLPAKKIEAPKPAPTPAPAKKVEPPKPPATPTPENKVEASKPVKKPAKKASKKAAKKPA